MNLCKYVSILNEVDEIEEFVLQQPSLRFSNLKTFNDLFECTILFDGITSEEIQNLINSLKKKNKEIDEEKVKELLTKKRITQNSRVCCLNQVIDPNPNDELLWAHYGDNHKGICIVYDGDKLLSKFPSGENITINNEISCNVFHRNVDYSSRERMIFENGKLTKSFTLEDILFQKNPCWKYENEFRIVLTNNNFEKDSYFMQIDYDCIKEIIFGYRLQEKYKKQICDYYERTESSHIDFFSLGLNDAYDSFIKIPFQKTDFDYNREFNYGRPMRRKINTLLEVIPESCVDEKLYEEKLKKEYKFYSRRLFEDSGNMAHCVSTLYELMIELARMKGTSRKEVISQIEKDFQNLGDYSDHNMIQELR